MPRGARLDAPDTLHHVMVSGIEGRAIFCDDQDREDFLRRLGGGSRGEGPHPERLGILTGSLSPVGPHGHHPLGAGRARPPDRLLGG